MERRPYPSMPVWHWLGLGAVPPEGLHGPKRRFLVHRHTTGLGKYRPHGPYAAPAFGPLAAIAREKGNSVAKALSIAYPSNRERVLMRLLRQQRLDDTFWRSVYALMVTGRQIHVWQLLTFLNRLTDPDPKVAEQEAERIYRRWMYLVREDR